MNRAEIEKIVREKLQIDSETGTYWDEVCNSALDACEEVARRERERLMEMVCDLCGRTLLGGGTHPETPTGGYKTNGWLPITRAQYEREHGEAK